MSRRGRRTLATLLLGMAACCGGPARVRYERGLERTPAPARHAVHSERLGELMRGLERLRFERLPQAMDVHRERQLQTQEIARAAAAMAASAEEIREAAGELALEPDEQEAFLLLAEDLRRRCQQLADTVELLSPAQRRASAEAIGSTCARCHERFRIPGATRVPD
jgi:cytochrome c556